MDLLVSALAFSAVFLGVLGVATFVRPRPAGQRLARLGGGSGAASAPRESLLVGREARPLLRLLSRLGASSSGAETGALRRKLVHAGYRRASAPAVFYGLRIALALGLSASLLPLPALWSVPYVQMVVLMCAAAGAGFVVPGFWVDWRKAQRQAELRRALPDALDLMVVCVEAGYAINASLARVSQEFASKSPVLSSELALVTAETRAGKSLTDALRGLSERTGVEDVSSLVALLVQTERFGTSVANALRVHAEAMRKRRMQRAEERAQKAPLKLIFPSTLIFVALMLIFLAPSVYRFAQAFPD